MDHPIRGLLGLLLLVVIALGCGSGADPEQVVAGDGTEDGTSDDQNAAEGQDPAEPSLVGSSWTLRSGTGVEGDIEPVDGWPITLTFDEETLGGTAACNGYGGSFTVDGSAFQVSELGATAMGCAPPVQEAEQRYLSALPQADTIELVDGRLTLSGPEVTLVFEANEPIAGAEVFGTLWLLETMIQGDTASSVAGDPATLLLQPDGAMTGSTGCRTLEGRYTVFGNEVQLNEFFADGECPSALFGQDSMVIGVLGDGFVTEVEGGVLTVTSSGNQGLQYRATTEDEVAGLDGTPVASDADLLEGVEWVFAGGDGPDGSIADPRDLGPHPETDIAPGDGITLMVSGRRLQGMAVCREYSGVVDVGNGRWTISDLAAEEEGCGEEFDAIVEAYFAALPLMSEFGLEADGERLVTNGNEIELWFERAG